MTTIQIKKAGQDPQVINVPEGAKIIIEDGVTIVEPKFKDGDIVFGLLDGDKWIGIYRSKFKSDYFSYHASIRNYSLEYSNYVSNNKCQRLATESEKQLLFDALAKDGMQWNPDTKQIEELKYIPKEGDCVEFDYIGGNHKKKGYFVAKIINGEIFGSGDWLAINHNSIHCKRSFSYTKNINEWIFRKITPEELQSKFNELGYEYKFETHTAEKLRWNPKEGEIYYYPDQFCSKLYRRAVNDTDSFDKKCIELKLAFKTPEEAIEIAKKWLQQL